MHLMLASHSFRSRASGGEDPQAEIQRLRKESRGPNACPRTKAPPEVVAAEREKLERKVLEVMAQGLSNKGICEKLVVSPKTVETHVNSIFWKLGLVPAQDEHRRVLAVLAYLRA